MTLPAFNNPTAVIRRDNLNLLIRAEAKGNASDFARMVGKDRRQVSAWATGRKTMADDTAREIETARRKPVGWMDRKHGDSSLSVHADSRIESQPQRLDDVKMAHALTLLRHLADLQDVPELVHDPVAIARAYEVIVEFDIPLTNDNVLDITKRLAARLRGNGDATGERDAAA